MSFYHVTSVKSGDLTMCLRPWGAGVVIESRGQASRLALLLNREDRARLRELLDWLDAHEAQP